MRLLATLVLLLAFPATAQQNQQAAPQGKATACPEYSASSGSNNVNQAMGTNNQGCSDTAANPNARTTSKGGNSGQHLYPGVNR